MSVAMARESGEEPWRGAAAACCCCASGRLACSRVAITAAMRREHSSAGAIVCTLRSEALSVVYDLTVDRCNGDSSAGRSQL